jgi:hypothetical protein
MITITYITVAFLRLVNVRTTVIKYINKIEYNISNPRFTNRLRDRHGK